jgi:hypothetical protein
MRLTLHAAAAVVVCAATPPLAAQSVYHGPGFDIAIPGRFEASQSIMGSPDEVLVKLYSFKGERSAVIIAQMRLPESAFHDSTLAGRRALVRLGRGSMLREGSWAVADGEPSDFDRDGRVGMRVPISVPPREPGQRTAYGTAEISVPRQGGLDVWNVMVFGPERSSETAAVADRVLDSFHLNGASIAGGGGENTP